MQGVNLEVLGWFASPLIDRAIGALGSLIGQNNSLNPETQHLLFELKTSLSIVQSAIEDLEMRPVPSQTPPEWLRDLKDAAYEALDVLDDIEYKKMHDNLNKEGNVSMIASFVSTIKTVISSDSDSDLEDLKLAARKLKKICDAVELKNSIRSLNFKDNEAQRAHKRKKNDGTTHHLDGLNLIGRDEERKLILDMIGIPIQYQPESSQQGTMRENSDTTNEVKTFGEGESSRPANTSKGSFPVLRVIPIVGIPGVGKTALAKVIYNDPGVIKHFEFGSWVYVPEYNGTETILRCIIESLGFSSSGVFRVNSLGLSSGQVRGNFKTYIGGKKVFIVLDNVRERDFDWAYLHRVLTQEVAPGSIVLVTTQSNNVADETTTMNHIRLGALPQKYFWPLFQHYAFGPNFNTLDHNLIRRLKKIGEEIAEKLNGLPLAAVITGSLLKHKLEIKNWEDILKSDWWNIGGQVLPSLAVSFQHLDMELRQCLTFCSLIPKKIFTSNDLIEMWISHDLIKPSIGGNNNLRDFANKMFERLLERNFFESVIGNVTFCLPNSVRDLAVALSANEMFIIKNENIGVPDMTRHLTICIDEPHDVQWGNYIMKRLRTLLIYGPYKKFNIFENTLSKSKNLRVLDLSCINLRKKQPHAISTLLHLRLLNLANTMIEVFPESFCQLFHLRVLNLNGCRFEELPRQFNQLSNLHFLHAHPKTTNLIYGIGKLTKLQSLNTFHIRNKEGFRLTELKCMNEIDGCLIIDGFYNISSKEEAIEAKLMQKKFLRRLEYIGGAKFIGPSSHASDYVEIFEVLKPHVNIEELVIEQYRETIFLGWMVEIHSFTNLTFIRLSFCNLVQLPILGQLPILAVLEINELNSITHINDNIYGNGTDIFPSLKELSFRSMSEWEEWSDAQEGRAMTSLKKLSVINCEKLRGIPFQSIGTDLMELHFHECGPFINEVSRYFQRFTALTTLKISYNSQRISIPCYNLKLLECLYLYDCRSLHFDGGLKSLTKLKKLEIMEFQEVNESLHPERSNREFGLGSLIYLEMSPSSNELIDMLGSLPLLRVLKVRNHTDADTDRDQWYSELTSLEEFEISGSGSLLLPSTITSLPSLKKLTIKWCYYMSMIPHNGIPQSLRELYIMDGLRGVLKYRCRREVGEDWPKIAHVPYIRINGETIQML